MKWLSNFAISRPVTTIIMIITMIGLGIISIFGIPMELMPNLNLPLVTIQVQYTGVSPEDMEELVAKPIEDAISGVQGIEKITSYSDEGSVFVLVKFAWGSDVDKKATDIREKMSKIRGKLPSDINEPTILKLDVMSNETVMIMNLSGDNLAEVRQYADDVLKPKFERINGVGSVEVYGGIEKEILVKVNPQRLNAYGLKVSDITALLASSSINTPAGKMKEGDKEFLVRVTGKIETLSEIKNLVVYNKDGKTLFLKDVCDIFMSAQEKTSYNRDSGKESVSINIIKESGGNTVSISDNIMKNFPVYKKALPKGMELTVARDSAKYIKDSMEMIRDSILLGFLLSAVIIFLFLKNIRATIVICLAIPTSVIFTFVLIKYMGISMNMLSMGGLALGIGRLVDDSIIVLENIFRHMHEYKKPAMEAARDGASEMGLPILASGLTTLAVFLPIILTQGLAGEIFRDFSYTVTFSLCASMIVALTFVPMISSRTLKVDAKELENEGELFKKVKDVYGKFLSAALKRRWIVVLVAFLMFLLSLGGLMIAGMEFFPKTDRGEFTITATMPNGLQLDKVNRVAKQIENIVSVKKKNDKFIEKYSTQVSPTKIDVFVTLSDKGSPIDKLLGKEGRKKGVEEVMAGFRTETDKIADANVKIAAAQMGPGGDSAIEVKLSGDDYKLLINLANETKEKLKGIKGVIDIKSSYEGGSPELKIKIDREKAEYYGLSIGYISNIVSSKIKGSTAFNVQSAGEEIGVKVQVDEDFRNSKDEIEEIEIPLTGKDGGSIRLTDVALIEVGEGPTRIIRDDKQKVISVTANNFGRDLGSVSKDITAVMSKTEMPQGYSYKFGGDQKDMLETMGALGIAFGIAIFLMYAVMAAQFESFVYPGIVMVTVPLGIIGVAIGLLVTGFSVSVTVLIGIIMLSGIVVNNAIVLIDYINILRAREIPREEAVKTAGLTRIRPIFMTVATAAIAMVPLAMGIGAGADFYQPLAITVIFGLIVSTLLTLIVIPVLYSLIDDIMAGLVAAIKKIGKKGRKEVAVVNE